MCAAPKDNQFAIGNSGPSPSKYTPEFKKGVRPDILTF
jgi:hypothetical protein